MSQYGRQGTLYEHVTEEEKKIRVQLPVKYMAMDDEKQIWLKTACRLNIQLRFYQESHLPPGMGNLKV